MGGMNEVNGLLILAGMGIKKKGHGGREKTSGASVKKIPLPAVKIKKGRGEIKNICPQKQKSGAGLRKGTVSALLT